MSGMNTYLTWLLDRIERLRHDRRCVQYARYRASAKGWERTRRYNDSFTHQEACRRYRDSHCRGEGSYQTHTGRWVGLMKVDPADKAAALWEARNGRLGGCSSAERMVMTLGHRPEVMHHEEAWNTVHAHFGKEFSNEHVRQYWTKKHRRWKAREAASDKR